MKRLLLLGAIALLASCNKAEAPADNAAIEDNLAVDTNMADANMTAPAGMSHLHTSWEWTEEGKKMVLSVDPAGAYIIEADGAHVDHGTYAVKGGKDCFTSAMGAKETDCWTAIPETAVGSSATSSSDKGLSGTYKRVEYRALKLPS